MKIIEAIVEFANTEMAWVYICCILAAVLCIIYSLIMWGWDRDSTSVQSSMSARHGRRMIRPRTNGRRRD